MMRRPSNGNEVSRCCCHPFPYGFVIGTAAADGCNVDCFIITTQPLKSGHMLECQALGLMEQFEDGHPDHNVLATPVGDQAMVDDTVQRVLRNFVSGVFADVPGKQMAVGRFLGRDDALAHVMARTSETQDSRTPR
jgi:inorganic pyrophosphatase